MRPLLVLLGLIAAGPAAAGDDACRLLLRHVPAADVAYRAGLDVRGRPVAPADLTPPLVLDGPILVDLTLPAGLLPRGGRLAFDAADVIVGIVEIDPTSGAVAFNGQPLSDPEVARLVAYCRWDRRLPPLPAHKPMP